MKTGLDLLASPTTSDYLGGCNALFIHNWRTGGTSLHSLLKANFLSRYIKIGDQFNRFGKLKTTPLGPVNTLRDIRSRISKGSIVAGHLFAGLESFLPYKWDLWVSAREPIARIRSGLLRFHSRELRNFNKNSINIVPHSVALTSPDAVQKLLATSLYYENNGFCRRLSALSLAENFLIDSSCNIEKHEVLSLQFNDDDLYSAAKSSLSKIKILFLTDSISASVLCLEKAYSLPPLINPFSAMSHNSARIVGYSESHVRCLDEAESILKESQAIDIHLWPHLKNKFEMQLKNYAISKTAVKAREAIHSHPLFLVDWFSPNYTASNALSKMADALKSRVDHAPELGAAIISAVTEWPCLTDEARAALASLAG